MPLTLLWHYLMESNPSLAFSIPLCLIVPCVLILKRVKRLGGFTDYLVSAVNEGSAVGHFTARFKSCTQCSCRTTELDFIVWQSLSKKCPTFLNVFWQAFCALITLPVLEYFTDSKRVSHKKGAKRNSK